MSRYSTISTLSPEQVKREIKIIRETGNLATKDKDAAMKLLYATGMYTKAGKLKPQFR